MHTSRIVIVNSLQIAYFDGSIINLLSVLCIWIEICSRTHSMGKKILNDVKSGTFIGRFRHWLLQSLRKRPVKVPNLTSLKIFPRESGGHQGNRGRERGCVVPF